LLAQHLEVGTAYCLLDGFNRSQVVYFVIAHNLGLTATAWLATG
jgi:hypothetical protein